LLPMMRNWRNPFLALLALVATGITAWPAGAWFCPVTGRTEAAATVCAMPGGGQAAGAGQTAAGSLPCCSRGQMSHCCKPLPSTPQDSGQTAALPAFQNVTASVLDRLNTESHPVPTTAALMYHPFNGVADAGLDSILTTSSLLLSPQHAPPAFSGRAPPLS